MFGCAATILITEEARLSVRFKILRIIDTFLMMVHVPCLYYQFEIDTDGVVEICYRY